MAWRARWLAVTLARSFMARLVGGCSQHAGNQARQDIERGSACRRVEPFPRHRHEEWRKRTRQWIGRIEKGQVQLHGGSPAVAPTPRAGRRERRRDGATEANRRD